MDSILFADRVSGNSCGNTFQSGNAFLMIYYGLDRSPSLTMTPPALDSFETTRLGPTNGQEEANGTVLQMAIRPIK